MQAELAGALEREAAAAVRERMWEDKVGAVKAQLVALQIDWAADKRDADDNGQVIDSSNASSDRMLAQPWRWSRHCLRHANILAQRHQLQHLQHNNDGGLHRRRGEAQGCECSGFRRSAGNGGCPYIHGSGRRKTTGPLAGG